MVNTILGVIGSLLYPLFSIIFLLMQILQSLFYSFAGIGTVYYNENGSGFSGLGGTPITGDNPTGDKYDTGILYYLFQSDIVKNILISMMLLALFLLVIFTTLAFIKTIYADKPKNWKDIITNTVKGLTNFIVLPVCCLLGVWVGNILLQAINGATSQGSSFSMDRKLFICCAYNANIYRGDGAFDSTDRTKANEAYSKIKTTIDLNPCLSGIKVEQDKDSEYYAQIVDQMYSVSNDKGALNIYTQSGVKGYYRLYDINYFLLIVGGIFIMYVLINVTYGMIKRLFILLMLFVVSPAVCSLYPLDEGGAVKTWTGDVKKNILSAYGAVAGMNLFFSFAPLIENIKVGMFSWSAFAIQDIVQLILLICGLFCVNDFINTITGYVGGGNALADGKSLRGSAKGALQKNTKKVGSVVGAFNNARAVGQAGGFGAGAKSLFTSATSGVPKSLGLDWDLGKNSQKAVEDYQKKFNEIVDKKTSEKNIELIKKDKNEYIADKIQAERIKVGKVEGGPNDFTQEEQTKMAKTFGAIFDKMHDEQYKNGTLTASGLDYKEYLKSENISSKDDVVRFMREATQANGLDDKAQKMLAQAVAEEFNKNKGKNDKFMTADDVMKEVGKKATAIAAKETMESALAGLIQKRSDFEAQSSRITATDRANAEVVKDKGIDVVRANAALTDKKGNLTAEAKKSQALLASYNKVQEEKSLKEKMESAIKMYEDAMRRVAETQNEAMKAQYNSAADIIKNKLNQTIDPRKIAEAIKTGIENAGDGAKDKKQLDEIVKLLEQLKKENS